MKTLILATVLALTFVRADAQELYLEKVNRSAHLLINYVTIKRGLLINGVSFFILTLEKHDYLCAQIDGGISIVHAESCPCRAVKQ